MKEPGKLIWDGETESWVPNPDYNPDQPLLVKSKRDCFARPDKSPFYTKKGPNIQTGLIEIPSGRKLPIGACIMNMFEDDGLLLFHCSNGLSFNIKLKEWDIQ